MRKQKAFTLVELLVAMAVIAVLLGLAVFGITIVQQNARDTQRRAIINDIEIAINSAIVSGTSLPSSFTAGAQTLTIGGASVPLSGSLQRVASGDTTTAATSSTLTDYCYGTSGSTYVVGLQLESGSYYYVTNASGTYTTWNAAPTTGTGPVCTDTNL